MRLTFEAGTVEVEALAGRVLIRAAKEGVGVGSSSLYMETSEVEVLRTALLETKKKAESQIK